MTKPAREGNPRWAGFLLAALVAALVTLFGAGTASAATVSAAQTRVGAHTPTAQDAVGPGVGIGAGQRLGNDPPAYDFALATGVAAKSATPVAKAGSAVVHGNSRLSLKTTHLYRLSDDAGNYLKTGVTSNPGSRYSQKFLVDKRLDFLTSGSRSNMLNLERFIVERDPGPLNFERWAGNFAGDVP